MNNGRWSGEQVRNVYPLLVNKTVYEGLVAAGKEPMILTRCGFPGIQRYGSALWSGDVGNDWDTFGRQIVAGLGVQAAGHPWWTYDAGGFFRPRDQYTNQDYIERMLRWIETSVYLPLMRVHGYMSNTEPWNYGDEAKEIFAKCLKEREQLRPYIEKCARPGVARQSCDGAGGKGVEDVSAQAKGWLDGDPHGEALRRWTVCHDGSQQSIYPSV